jgi:acyl carrier protein
MQFEQFFQLMKEQLSNLTHGPLEHLLDDTPLLSTGLVDSLAIVDLIGFVEERWRVQVEPMELSVDNFGSISAMFDFVQRKVAEAA